MADIRVIQGMGQSSQSKSSKSSRIGYDRHETMQFIVLEVIQHD